MLVIPFVVNLLIFWVTDNFLMRHDQHQHKRSFLINYVSNKMGKGGQANGFHNGNATMTATGNASTTTNNINGKFATRHLYERAKQYCSQSLDNIDNSLSSKLNQMEKSHRFKHFDNNDESESDALLSGDERCFDVEFTDDDCVALEPRGPHMNS